MKTETIIKRMRELRERRSFHHVHKAKVEKRENGYESSMVIRVKSRVYAHGEQRKAIDAYEAEDWGTLERGAAMHRAGMGVATRKKSHIRGSQKPNPDMKEGVGTVGTIIATKRFNNSRLTCVCKTRKY